MVVPRCSQTCRLSSTKAITPLLLLSACLAKSSWARAHLAELYDGFPETHQPEPFGYTDHPQPDAHGVRGTEPSRKVVWGCCALRPPETVLTRRVSFRRPDLGDLKGLHTARSNDVIVEAGFPFRFPLRVAPG